MYSVHKVLKKKIVLFASNLLHTELCVSCVTTRWCPGTIPFFFFIFTKARRACWKLKTRRQTTIITINARSRGHAHWSYLKNICSEIYVRKLQSQQVRVGGFLFASVKQVRAWEPKVKRQGWRAGPSGWMWRHVSGGANLAPVMCDQHHLPGGGSASRAQFTVAIWVSPVFTQPHVVSRVNALLPLRHLTANNEAFCLLSANCRLQLRTCFSWLRATESKHRAHLHPPVMCASSQGKCFSRLVLSHRRPLMKWSFAGFSKVGLASPLEWGSLFVCGWTYCHDVFVTW